MIRSPNSKRQFMVEENPNTARVKRHYFLKESNALKAAQQYQTPVWVPLLSGWKQAQTIEGE